MKKEKDRTCFLKGQLASYREFKGQMNQKIDIFSFVALPSPNTKKNHPKWDLSKDFSSHLSLYRKIKDQNPSIS